MSSRILAFGLLVLGLLSASGCGRRNETPQEKVDTSVRQALEAVGMNRDALSLPKLGGRQVSLPGRLPAVDRALSDPLSMIELSRGLLQVDPAAPPSLYLAALLRRYGMTVPAPSGKFAVPTAAQAWAELAKSARHTRLSNKAPSVWDQNTALFRALRLILLEAGVAEQAYQRTG